MPNNRNAQHDDGLEEFHPSPYRDESYDHETPQEHFCNYCDRLVDTDVENPVLPVIVQGVYYHQNCWTSSQMLNMPSEYDHYHDVQCPVCTQEISDSHHVHIHGLGAIVHRYCVRNRLNRLVCDCGSLTLDMRIINGRYTCGPCYDNRLVTCLRCGTERRIMDGMTLANPHNSCSGYVCHDCRESMVTCPRCYRLFEPSSTTGLTDGRCLSCFNMDTPQRRVHRYNLKPKPRFHGKATIQYGLELEVDGFPSDEHKHLGLGLLYKAEKGESSFYIKTDGSLNNGYELVFHPRELGSWYNYHKKLSALTSAIQSAGGKSFSTSTCGIHVHRGITDISSYHIVKMSYLLGKFRRFTRAAAMRGSCHYSHEVNLLNLEHKADPHKIIELFKMSKMSASHRRHSVDRYLQLNFQNENTIELRIFKGNLNVEAILGCVMFFDRLVEFTRKQTIKSMENMNEKEIIGLFSMFCKTMTTRSTLGKRKNNEFARVSDAVTGRLERRLAQALETLND